MTPAQFKQIRATLGLTQAKLAKVMGYAYALQISSFERASNPIPVPRSTARLMRAYRDGYRPDDWPALK